MGIVFAFLDTGNGTICVTLLQMSATFNAMSVMTFKF